MSAYVVRDQAGSLRLAVDPTVRSGWSHTGLYVVDLGAGDTRTTTLEGQEALVIPLAADIHVGGERDHERLLAFEGRRARVAGAEVHHVQPGVGPAAPYGGVDREPERSGLVTDDVRAHRHLRLCGYVVTLLAGAPRDERLEDRSRRGVGRVAHLGVPLDGYQPRVIGRLDGLDDAVRCGGDDIEACAEVPDRLVMEAGDRDRASDQLVQPAAVRQRHVVCGEVPGGTLRVLDGTRYLAGDVLVEGAAVRDVDELDAAADREDRDAPALGLHEQRQLVGVAIGRGGVELRMGLFAVRGGGVDVHATRQQ